MSQGPPDTHQPDDTPAGASYGALGDRPNARGTTVDEVTPTPSNSLEVRCPSCSTPFAVASDTEFTDLVCVSCGEGFSLVDAGVTTRSAPSLAMIGRFALVDRLGVGGFGTVWKARDNQLDRTVALKIARRGWLGGDEAEKFFREARAAAQLNHPSIVSVYEVGRDNDSIFIVSELVRGVTLGDWLTGQQVTGREAAEICIHVAEALHHAHEQGVVHRDLKPSNIMIDADGRPKIMDFGVARRDVGELTVTADGQILGTPAYMPPEQASGDSHRADRRSDVYSLGVILFELLTGERPFRGNARMLLHQVIHKPPPRPRQLNATIPANLETVTLKCLEKNPDRRYQTAQEVADELRRFVEGRPILARPVTPLERAWRWANRNRAVAALMGLIIVVVCTGLVVGPLVAAQQASLRREAEEASAKAVAAAGRAETEAEKAKRLANVAGAKYALSQGWIQEAYQKIAAAIDSQPNLEYAGIMDEVIAESRRDWSLIQCIPFEGHPKWGCFVGRGPKWLVTSHDDWIEVRSPLTGRKPKALQLQGGGSAPCAIGEDKIAVALGDGTITMYSVPDLVSMATFALPGEVTTICSNPDASVIAASNSEGLVRVFDGQGTQLAERQFALEPVDWIRRVQIDVSPSGRLVAFCDGTHDHKKWTWDWKADELKSYEFDSFSFELASDEVAYGYTGVEPEVVFEHMNLITRRTTGMRNPQEVHRFLHTPTARLEVAGLPRKNGECAILYDLAIHRMLEWGATSGGARTLMTRYNALWPQSAEPPKLLAYDGGAQVLALGTGNEIVLFAPWRELSPFDPPASLEFSAREYTLAMDGNRCLTCGVDDFQIVDLNSLATTHLPWASPKPASGCTMHAARLASSRDHIAVLWQEMGFGSHDFQRKMAQIYGREDHVDGPSIELINEFELKACFGGNFYSTGELVMTPDGKTFAWCDSTGMVSRYDANKGELVSQTDFNSALYATYDSPALVGIADPRNATDFQILDVATGETHTLARLDSPVRCAAFAPDGESLYMGLTSDELRQYRVRDGKLLATTPSPVGPMAISPKGDRFIGIVIEAGRVGSLVLGELPSGQPLEVVNADAFTLDDVAFSADGSAAVFVSRSDEGTIVRTPNLQEARRRLEESALDPLIASQADELCDYRERLAAKFQESAGQGQLENRSLTEQIAHVLSSLDSAVAIHRALTDDFPHVREYRESLARRYLDCSEIVLDVDKTKALHFIEHALEIRRAIADESPENDESRQRLAEVEEMHRELAEKLPPFQDNEAVNEGDGQ